MLFMISGPNAAHSYQTEDPSAIDFDLQMWDELRNTLTAVTRYGGDNLIDKYLNDPGPERKFELCFHIIARP